MTFRKKLKITVLKKFTAEELYGGKLPCMPKYPLVCDRFEEGKEFIVEETGIMPQGFCPWAWDDLARVTTHLQFGGDFPWYEEKGMNISCCTDAIRPVVFKLERLER